MKKQIITAVLFLGILIFTKDKIYSQEGGVLKLKNRSSFSSGETTRNPFWPIGWRPKGAVMQETVDVEISLPSSAFTITSILLGENPLAVINGKGYMEGDQVPVQVGNQLVNAQVTSIQDGAVILRYENKEITATLNRK